MPTLQSGNEVVYNNYVMDLDSSLNCQTTQRNQLHLPVNWPGWSHHTDHQLTDHQLTDHQLTDHQLTDHCGCLRIPAGWAELAFPSHSCQGHCAGQLSCCQHMQPGLQCLDLPVTDLRCKHKCSAESGIGTQSHLLAHSLTSGAVW